MPRQSQRSASRGRGRSTGRSTSPSSRATSRSRAPARSVSRGRNATPRKPSVSRSPSRSRATSRVARGRGRGRGRPSTAASRSPSRSRSRSTPSRAKATRTAWEHHGETDETFVSEDDTTEELTLWKHPIKTVHYCGLEIWNGIVAQAHSTMNSSLQLGTFCAVAVLLVVLHTLNSEGSAVEHARFLLMDKGVHWIVLGFLSSAGLGSGLHTFVLYLGPHIVRVTMHAVKCREISLVVENGHDCPAGYEDLPEIAGIMSLFMHLFPECFLWGLGTAIGELPPYFFAYKARSAKDSLKDINSLLGVDDDKEDEEGKSVLKERVFAFFQKYTFVTVVIFASIPNPLFDFAGLICGHLRIPFFTFFGATLIGKAINKVSLQAILVIWVFFHTHGEQSPAIRVCETIENILPFLEGKLVKGINKLEATFGNTHENAVTEEDGGWIGWLVGWIVPLIIIWFLIQTVNALANKYQSDLKSQRTGGDYELVATPVAEKKKRKVKVEFESRSILQSPPDPSLWRSPRVRAAPARFKFDPYE